MFVLRLDVYIIPLTVYPQRAWTSQMFLRDTHILPKWLSYEKYCRQMVSRLPSDRTPGVNAVNLLFAVYDIHGIIIGRSTFFNLSQIPNDTYNSGCIVCIIMYLKKIKYLSIFIRYQYEYITQTFNFLLIKFDVSFTTILAFPRDSMSFTVHCQLVVYHCRSWPHRRHGVWVRVVG
jgi:hypothetical protein